MYICCLRPVIRCMSWFVSELHVQRWKWTMCVWLQSSQSCASEFPLNISNLHCLCTRFTFFTRLHSFVSLFPFCLIFQHVLLRFKSIVLHRSQVLFDRIYTWAVFTAATHHCCWCYCSSSSVHHDVLLYSKNLIWLPRKTRDREPSNETESECVRKEQG